MAIYDNDGTVVHELSRVFDNDGTASHQLGKLYDHDGAANHLIYSAEETKLTDVTFGTWYLYPGQTRSADSAAFDLSGHSQVQITGRFAIVMSYSCGNGMYSSVGAELILADETAVAIDSYGVRLWSAGTSGNKSFDKTISLSSYSSAQLKSCKIRGYMKDVSCSESKRHEGTVKVALVKGL